MQNESMSKDDDFRQLIEKWVLDLLKAEAVEKRRMTKRRAQQIAQLTLDKIIPGQPAQETYQCALELCSKIHEILSLLPNIVKEYNANFHMKPTDDIASAVPVEPITGGYFSRPLQKAMEDGFFAGVGAHMYCVKCRDYRNDPDAETITMKNGKPATKGRCPVCGTGMYRIGA